MHAPSLGQRWRSHVENLLVQDPGFRAGWEEFDRDMRRRYPREIARLASARDVYRASDAGRLRFTYMNFMRFVAQDASRLAFHHALTGHADSAAASADLLRWVFELPAWHSQAPLNGWCSDLWTADFAAHVGIALDLLGDYLGPGEAREMRLRLLSLGVVPLLEEWLDPERRIHALDSMGHNWWSVCVGGAAIGLYAAKQEWARANEWFDLIAEGIVEFFAYPGNVLQNKQANFGPGGDFIESVGYLDYALHHLILVFDLYRDDLGRDLAAEIPVLPAICDYYMACVQPLKTGVQRLNFGDMGAGPETVGSYAHQPAPVWLWLAGRFGRGDLLHLVRRTHPRPAEMFDFVFWPCGLRGESFDGAPGDRVFENSGVAILRDGYRDDATVLAIKTGEKWNHNQSDAGSYILSAKGVEFFIDPGTTGYSDPLHRSYFKSSHAHNVVLHGGRGQAEDLDDLGTKFVGRIASFLSAPGYKYVLADATGPWEGVYRRFYRHVLWLGDIIVMVDDLMAWQPGRWTSLFHYAGTTETREDGFTVRNGGLCLDATFVHPRPARLEMLPGYQSHMVPNDLKYEYRVDERPYLAAHFEGEGVRQKLLTVFRLPGSASGPIESISGDALSGMRAADESGSWTVLCNHRADGSVMHLNSHNENGGIACDGFLSVVRRDEQGRITSVGFHNASYLKADGCTLFSSLLKTDGHIRYSADSATFHARFTAPAWASIAWPGQTGSGTRFRVPSGDSMLEVGPVGPAKPRA